MAHFIGLRGTKIKIHFRTTSCSNNCVSCYKVYIFYKITGWHSTEENKVNSEKRTDNCKKVPLILWDINAVFKTDCTLCVKL